MAQSGQLDFIKRKENEENDRCLLHISHSLTFQIIMQLIPLLPPSQAIVKKNDRDCYGRERNGTLPLSAQYAVSDLP